MKRLKILSVLPEAARDFIAVSSTLEKMFKKGRIDPKTYRELMEREKSIARMKIKPVLQRQFGIILN